MCKFYDDDSYEDELDEAENEAGKHPYEDDDDISDDIIFFYDPDYGYVENEADCEEDCYEDNNLYNEN